MILPRRFIPGGYPPVEAPSVVCSQRLVEDYDLWGRQDIVVANASSWALSDNLEWMYLTRTLSNNSRGYKFLNEPGEMLNAGEQNGTQLSWTDVNQSSAPSINNCYGIFVDASGTRCFISGNDTALPSGQQRLIAEYSLPSPYENRISTPGMPGSKSAVYIGRTILYPIWGLDLNLTSLIFRPDGLRMYGSNGINIYQFSLSTAWNRSTLSYDGVNTSGIGANFYIEPTGTCLYSSFTSQRQIRQYSLPSPWDVLGVDASDEISRKTLGNLDYVNLPGIFVTSDRMFILSDLNANPDYRFNQYNYPGTDYTP